MRKQPKIEIYMDRDILFRWRLKSANGRIIADSGEAYNKRAEAHKAAWRVILACNEIGTHPDTDRVVDL
jgi:uncharacterized protein YegP (UPF0339 family)